MNRAHLGAWTMLDSVVLSLGTTVVVGVGRVDGERFLMRGRVRGPRYRGLCPMICIADAVRITGNPATPTLVKRPAVRRMLHDAVDQFVLGRTR